MNIRVAALAASLSSLGGDADRSIHGPLTLQDELASVSAQAHALLDDGILSYGCRLVVERLTSIVDALARHDGCLRADHADPGAAVHVLVSSTETMPCTEAVTP